MLQRRLDMNYQDRVTRIKSVDDLNNEIKRARAYLSKWRSRSRRDIPSEEIAKAKLKAKSAAACLTRLLINKKTLEQQIHG